MDRAPNYCITSSISSSSSISSINTNITSSLLSTAATQQLSAHSKRWVGDCWNHQQFQIAPKSRQPTEIYGHLTISPNPAIKWTSCSPAAAKLSSSSHQSFKQQLSIVSAVSAAIQQPSSSILTPHLHPMLQQPSQIPVSLTPASREFLQIPVTIFY